MQQYLDLLSKLLNQAKIKDDRTKVGTVAVFGHQMRFNLKEGFPLLTTKKVHFASVVHELLWFLNGDTNIQTLNKNKCTIWNDWRYKEYKEYFNSHNNNVSIKPLNEKEFAEKIANDDEFAKLFGDIGKGYGHQWRKFGEITESIALNFETSTHVIKKGFDQISWVVNEIKTNPNSRRLIVSGWNPHEVDQVDLPPCHTLFQFFVQDGKLSCQLYQRSADTFLGVPFNVSSYALLTHMVAQCCDLDVGEFIWTGGDTHLYLNHIEQAKIQLQREPKKLCTLKLNPEIKNIFDFKFSDIELVDYQHHEKIYAPVAV